MTAHRHDAMRLRRPGRLALLVAVATMLLLPRTAPSAERQNGYDSEQFRDPLGFWAELAEGGNVEAMYGLGLAYDLGNGVPRDVGMALQWYRRAADAGFPAAAFNVAVIYDSGQGVARDPGLAALWYARAAVRGHHRAQFNLGQLYEAGDGVPRNPAVAAVWYRAAADGGIAAAAARRAALAKGSAEPPQRRQESGSNTAHPDYPNRDLITASADGALLVPLVWTVPADAGSSRFQIEVRSMDNEAKPVIYLGVTDQTATLVKLPSSDAVYAWRVGLLRQGQPTMIASDWAWFTVRQKTADGPVGKLDNRAETAPDRASP